MYSTCTFCFADLGRNQIIEACPVGTKLAFDAAKGRLWVICRACGRWNLSPLEERWEAIETAERSYGSMTVRGATENISIAKARDGTVLVRVGSPRRPEFATWRYGAIFTSRFRRRLAMGGVFLGGTIAVVATGSLAALAAIPGGALLMHVPELAHTIYSRYRVIARFEQADGSHALLRGKDVSRVQLRSAQDAGWSLLLPHSAGEQQVSQLDAMQAVTPILTYINRRGATRREVSSAVDRLESTGSAEAAFQQIASDRSAFLKRGMPPTDVLEKLPYPSLLALEMAAQEEIEHRAAAGELRYLVRSWREAEEIAAISDSLLLPDRVLSYFRKHKDASAAIRTDENDAAGGVV